MKSFKEKIQDFEPMNEKIDFMAPNYGSLISQIQGLLRKMGSRGMDPRATKEFIGKDNGREAIDDAKILIALVKQLRKNT